MLSAARYATRDLTRATAFYDALAALLGAQRIFERHDAVSYRGAEGGVFQIGLPREGEASVGNGVQMTFAAAGRHVVDTVHAKALELGGRCEGPPGVRGPDRGDPNGFYCAYFRDLDGNKLMVFHQPRPPA